MSSGLVMRRCLPADGQGVSEHKVFEAGARPPRGGQSRGGSPGEHGLCVCPASRSGAATSRPLPASPHPAQGRGFALGDESCCVCQERTRRDRPSPRDTPAADTASAELLLPAAEKGAAGGDTERRGQLGTPGCKAAPLVCSRDRGPAPEPSAALVCGFSPARAQVMEALEKSKDLKALGDPQARRVWASAWGAVATRNAAGGV
ncbi:uncharacterized protein [Patagioenas fasciata]|uniref:uncharacterized protein n=1 Tax=Patagioenas fasciata TaxID=372321 RepID=UPI003A992755